MYVQTCQPKTFSITFLQPKDRGGDGCSSLMGVTTPAPMPNSVTDLTLEILQTEVAIRSNLDRASTQRVHMRLRPLFLEPAVPTSEERELILCTFKPKINASPRPASRASRRRKVAWSPTSEERELIARCTFKPKINTSPRPVSSAPRRRKEAWPPTSEEREVLDHCTFKPKINAPKTNAHPEKARAEHELMLAQQRQWDFGRSLYGPKTENLKTAKPPLGRRFTSEERELLNHCTFQPKTNAFRESWIASAERSILCAQ
jgi:hypothetical protein